MFPMNNNFYVSCGAGYVNVITQVDPNNYKRKLKIETRGGARTSLFIPKLNQFVVAAPARNGKNAQLMIYQSK